MSKNDKKYNFIKASNPQDEFHYKPEQSITKFYQVCLFKNPWSNKYHVRKLVFDEYGYCLDVVEHKLSQHQYDKFKKKYKGNQYKSYSAYSLDDIKPPSGGEMLTAESSLLGDGQNSFNGYSSFN
jgi:hypothetical protein